MTVKPPYAGSSRRSAEATPSAHHPALPYGLRRAGGRPSRGSGDHRCQFASASGPRERRPPGRSPSCLRPPASPRSPAPRTRLSGRRCLGQRGHQYQRGRGDGRAARGGRRPSGRAGRAQRVRIQSAETILKYPDFNAAEALGRMPDISLSSDTGEGRFVQIRGIDATSTARPTAACRC